MTRDVAEFIVPKGAPLYRVHYEGLEAHFSSTGRGRFDLTSKLGSGTCYIADDPLGAFVESLGRVKIRATTDIASRRLSTFAFDRDVRLFDLTARRNRWVYDGWDVNADLASGDDYERPQQFAAFVDDRGFDGIYYSARHDPSHSLRSIALFGEVNSTSTSAYADCDTDNVPRWLIERAIHEFGFQVIDEEPLP